MLEVTSIDIEVVVVFGFSWIAGNVMIDSLGKVSKNCFQGGDCWVVTMHTLVVTIQRFLKRLVLCIP